MTISSKYQDFSHFASPNGASISQTEMLEEDKLQTFEKGYQAGWEDAVKAHEADQLKAISEISQNLQDASFTYHEALSKLTSSMKPLMAEIVDRLLPELSKGTLALHVKEQLETLIDSQTERNIEIVVSADTKSELETVLERNQMDEIRVRVDSDLPPCKAYIRVGADEREIDLQGVVEGIREGLAAFFNQGEPK